MSDNEAHRDRIVEFITTWRALDHCRQIAMLVQLEAWVSRVWGMAAYVCRPVVIGL